MINGKNLDENSPILIEIKYWYDEIRYEFNKLEFFFTHLNLIKWKWIGRCVDDLADDQQCMHWTLSKTNLKWPTADATGVLRYEPASSWKGSSLDSKAIVFNFCH